MTVEAVQYEGAPGALINEEMVKCVVHNFYARARHNAVLGPILRNAVGLNWTEYISLMTDYWTSVLLNTERYHGNPILAHLQHSEIKREHFDLWLGLWRETAEEFCAPPAAAEFVRKAEEIGNSLKLNLYEKPNFRQSEYDPYLSSRLFTTQPDDQPDVAKPDINPAPALEIHPRIYSYVFGAYAWMLFSLWMALRSDGGAVFMIAISSFFLAMYAGVPYLLSALGRRYSGANAPKRNDFGTFLDKDISTFTGTITGREALIQITIIPILLALGMSAIALIISHARA